MNANVLRPLAGFSYSAALPHPASLLSAEARCRDGSGLARYVAASPMRPDRLGMVEATPRTLFSQPAPMPARGRR